MNLAQVTLFWAFGFLFKNRKWISVELMTHFLHCIQSFPKYHLCFAFLEATLISLMFMFECDFPFQQTQQEEEIFCWPPLPPTDNSCRPDSSQVINFNLILNSGIIYIILISVVSLCYFQTDWRWTWFILRLFSFTFPPTVFLRSCLVSKMCQNGEYRSDFSCLCFVLSNPVVCFLFLKRKLKILK